MEFENELDKLRALLDEAGIPYISYKEEYIEKEKCVPELFVGNKRYKRNQVIYGIRNEILHQWKLDGICHFGSYGVDEGLIETYGELGVDGEGDPLILRAEDVFQIIKEDWEKENG